MLDTENFILEQMREHTKELKRMNDVLTINTESLKTHIRRTELLEHATLRIEGRVSDLEIKKIEKDAVRKWIISSTVISGKVLAGVGAVIGAVAGFPIVAQWLVKILTP